MLIKLSSFLCLTVGLAILSGCGDDVFDNRYASFVEVFEGGDYVKADQMLDSLIVNFGDKPVLYYMKARCYKESLADFFQTDFFRGFRGWWGAPRILNKDEMPVFVSEQINKAIKHYYTVFKKFPKSNLADDALAMCAGLSIRAGEFQKAFDLLLTLFQQYPDTDMYAEVELKESLFLTLLANRGLDLDTINAAYAKLHRSTAYAANDYLSSAKLSPEETEMVFKYATISKDFYTLAALGFLDAATSQYELTSANLEEIYIKFHDSERFEDAEKIALKLGKRMQRLDAFLKVGHAFDQGNYSTCLKLASSWLEKYNAAPDLLTICLEAMRARAASKLKNIVVLFDATSNIVKHSYSRSIGEDNEFGAYLRDFIYLETDIIVGGDKYDDAWNDEVVYYIKRDLLNLCDEILARLGTAELDRVFRDRSRLSKDLDLLVRYDKISRLLHSGNPQAVKEIASFSRDFREYREQDLLFGGLGKGCLFNGYKYLPLLAYNENLTILYSEQLSPDWLERKITEKFDKIEKLLVDRIENDFPASRVIKDEELEKLKSSSIELLARVERILSDNSSRSLFDILYDDELYTQVDGFKEFYEYYLGGNYLIGYFIVDNLLGQRSLVRGYVMDEFSKITFDSPPLDDKCYVWQGFSRNSALMYHIHLLNIYAMCRNPESVPFAQAYMLHHFSFLRPLFQIESLAAEGLTALARVDVAGGLSNVRETYSRRLTALSRVASKNN